MLEAMTHIWQEQMKLKLILPLPVSVNALYVNQTYYDPKKKTHVPTGKRILSPKGRKAKKQIQSATRKQLKGQEWDYEYTRFNYLYQDMVVYFNRMGRDSDNLLKCLNDSLKSIAYHNDDKILTRIQKVMVDSNNPRIEIELHPVEFKGIFHDKAEADRFQEICEGCSHYRKGRCSILVESLEGRVREEIHDVEKRRVCMKYTKRKGE
jgi:Holliday junction resolvase RusA-like endonuclease